MQIINKSKTRPLFYRKFRHNSDSMKYWNLLASKISINKIKSLNKSRMVNIYNIKFEDVLFAYKFYLLKKWINNNLNYNKAFVINLQNTINILNLEQWLNEDETNYINYINAVVFAKTRNIKNLIVNFETLNKEEIWYTYDLTGVFSNEEIICKNSYIFLTNYRIIVNHENQIKLEIKYDDVVEIKLKNNSLIIITTKNTYKIIAFQIEVVYVSIERISQITKRYI